MNLFFSKLFGLLKNKKVLIAILVIALAIGVWQKFFTKSQSPQYQTAQATKGTLISSVSESGQVVASNRVEITTQASGVVSNVYVKDGDTVSAGQTIADITLDTDGQKNQAQAYAAYLSAQNSVSNAQAQVYSLQSTMFTKWQNYLNLAQNSTYTNGDGSPNVQNRQSAEFISTNDDWLAAETQFANAKQLLAQSQAQARSALLSYQAASNAITAPQSGVITDIVITPGLQIKSSTTGSSNTIASQPVASIQTEGSPIISASLSEIDAVKIQSGQKATITLDAFPDKTFTGKVSGVDTTGVVSSGVTTYPATVVMDTQNNKIFPNMSATVNIITAVKDNVLLVPTAAIQTANGQSSVRVLKNGKITDTPVTIGDSSSTDTEVTEGLSEGDTVVIGFVSTGQGQSTASPFSRSLFGGGAGGGAFGGGNRVFINAGGGGARGNGRGG